MSARTYPCCDCCPSDPIFHADNPPDSHDVPCDICSPTCGHNVERIRREAKAEALRQASNAAEGMHDPVAFDCREWAAWLRGRAARIEADEWGSQSLRDVLDADAPEASEEGRS